MAYLYSEVSETLHEWASATDCPFCDCRLVEPGRDVSDALLRGAHQPLTSVCVRYCADCGWKCAQASRRESTYWGDRQIDFGGVSCLRAFETSDAEIPIGLLRQRLLADFSRRFEVHPRKLEELTESIFREKGYTTLLTPYSGDDGIDIFLYKNDSLIGVQVKRFKHSIEVSQIREFVGALELSNTKKGVFVTTSRYTKGVHRTVQKYSERGWSVDLIDSDSLYDALNISRLPRSGALQLDGQAFVALVEELRFIEEWHDW